MIGFQSEGIRTVLLSTSYFCDKLIKMSLFDIPIVTELIILDDTAGDNKVSNETKTQPLHAAYANRKTDTSLYIREHTGT